MRQIGLISRLNLQLNSLLVLAFQILLHIQILENNTALTLQSGSFADLGFMLGDTIIISWGWLGGGATYNNAQSHTRTITYVAGNIMYISAPLTWQPTADVVGSGTVFPSSGLVNGMLIVADKAPDSIQMQFNLAPNGSSTPNSVIDGEVTRLEKQQYFRHSYGNSSSNDAISQQIGRIYR